MFMTRRFRTAAWLACLSLGIFLAACGSDDKPNATPTPSSPPTASSSEQSGPTVGNLADQIAAVWSSVTSFRTVSGDQSGAGHASATLGTPTGASNIEVTTDIVLPDRKHQTTSVNGAVEEEYLVVDGKLYSRGSGVIAMPSTPVAGGWNEVDTTAVDPQSPAAQLVATLMAPVQPLYAGLSDDERERNAKPLGTITVNDKSCQAFQIVDTTQTGERIEIILAIGADNLPCSIETKVGGTDYLTTFSFNIPLTINAPGATPVTLATPPPTNT
jgi:hypothetical protein